MNTFKDLINSAKQNTYGEVHTPLYIVSKSTGKITTVNISHPLNTLPVYFAGGKDFHIDKDTNVTVLERIVYAGHYNTQKMVTHYLFINKEDAKAKALEILNEKKKNIENEIREIEQM